MNIDEDMVVLAQWLYMYQKGNPLKFLLKLLWLMIVILSLFFVILLLNYTFGHTSTLFSHIDFKNTEY